MNEKYQLIQELDQLRKKTLDLEDEIIRLKLELKIRGEMINTIPNPLFVKNKDFKYTICNDAFAKHLGLPKSEIINSTVYDISPKELADKYHAADCELRDQSGKQEYESKVKYADGTLHDIIFNKACLVDEKNEFLGIVGVMLDITKRKRAEEKLRESAEKHHTILKTTLNGFWIVNMLGELIEVNDAYCRMSGYSKDELLSKKISDFEAIENSVDTKKRINKIIETGSDCFETKHLRKDGSIYHVEISIQYHQFDGGRIICFISDITERKQAEQELIKAKEKAEENEEKFKLLNRLTSEMLLLKDMESIYEFIAINLQKQYPNTIVLKVSIDESIQQTRLEAISGLDNSLLMKVIKITGFNPIGKNYKLTDIHNSYFKSGNFIEFDGGLAEFSDSEFPAFAAAAIEKLIGLHKIYTIGINKDEGLLGAIHFITFNKQVITDGNFIEIFVKQAGLVLQKKIDTKALIKAKEKAEEADRLKSAFLANMSHEIRTPMNGILGFTSLLQEPNLTGEEQQQYIEIIQKSGDRMLNTVNDIIDISKIESGLVELSVSEVNIYQQLKYLHSFFKPEAANNETELLFKNDTSEPDFSLKTDFEKFNSIVTNLVKNAIKFTRQGTIELGYNIKKKKGSTKVEFYVKDTGIGISKARQRAIFDRFVQADIEDKRALQGSGLGLAISKAYVEMLGGKIWLKSVEGIGSTFYFTLPYNAEPKENEVVEKVNSMQNEKNPINPEISGLKILIAEDDQTSAELFKITLERFAQEIIIARNGFEAVESCRKNPDIDLILMDIQLPNLDGYNATKQIRQFNKEVVIIAQTAYALSGDREKAIAAGCNYYISKPIIKDELLSLIQKYFK